MVPWHCQNCGPTEAETDERMGHIVCLECGAVLEENIITSEVTFSETSKGSAIADGFQLSTGQGRTGNQESREQTLQNGHRRILEVANQPQIHMNERLVGHARRFFNVAVVNNFTKGRKSGNVVAACLYIVCRLEKTAHMLIDFADALSTNVYQVGATFLALCRIAGVEKLPLVDPSLYISRFASKLDFGEDTQSIIKDANRLVQRMCRDWMQTGRRPAGICAASLFVASRMHNHHRTIREIILVVKICEATLRRRLREFRETPSSNLTVTDFQTIWLEGEKDPPCFAPLKHRKTEALSSSLSLSDDDAKLKVEQAFSHLQASSLGGVDVLEEDMDELDEDQLLSFEEQVTGGKRQSGANGETNSLAGQVHGPDNLSDLDDDEEVQAMIDVTPEEVEFKEAVWTEENKEWIVLQEAKAALGTDAASIDKRKPKKRIRSAQVFGAPTPAEAAKNLLMSKPALSKKINYGVLESLFEKTEKLEKEVTTGG
ncbi:hypothetical protein BSLG_003121 [Batrachochytrium salamandrivorans]|nr:hypothetical protein BSLG_003896 [Batrachochytrium salamandrivorans]KAJ1342198.1 hypothetical protein BSLG_003121 [Batrachochytrium salamandrivorans]